MAKRKPILIGVSLTELEHKIILRENKRRGLLNISATVRMIIREWDSGCGAPARFSVTEAGREAMQENESA